MKNDKQRCGTRRYHQSEMKNPTTLISGTVTPKWTVPGERNLHMFDILFVNVTHQVEIASTFT